MCPVKALKEVSAASAWARSGPGSRSRPLGDLLIRRFLPIALVVLALVSFSAWSAHRKNWFGDATESVVVLSISASVLVGFMYCMRGWLNGADRERSAAQLKLRKSEERFRGLLDAAPDGMVIVDEQGQIVLVNSQFENLFGYSRAELEGKTIEMLLPERLREKHVGHRTGFFNRPQIRSMGASLDLFARHRDGREFPIEISLSPLQTDDGLLVSSAIRDATERKRFERELQESSRMKSEFLATMSHELRTPLNAIIGFSEFVSDEKAGPLNDKQKDFIKDVLASAQHLLELINDVLDVAKIEAGRMELNLEPFDLQQSIEDVATLVKGIARKKNIHIELQISSEPAQVRLDQKRFKQVLFNLLSNAVKFTNQGGKISVISRLNGSQLSISVADTGIGIRKEDIPRLFRHFEQLEPGISRQQEGTGLGLILTRRIVELHQGSISVQSEFGRGTTFTALFPMPKAELIPLQPKMSCELAH